MNTWGNTELLKLPKTAFLCSRSIPAMAVLKSYDWAKEQRQLGNCIICGNHSQLEKDVFEILLKGKQPLILVLARGMKTKWEQGIDEHVKTGRLLVLSPFDHSAKRVSRQTAFERNLAMIEMSDKVVVGHARVGGQLANLLKNRQFQSLES